MSAQPRPAFYALRRGGWRDYVTVLHLPYTAWHLSYVALGAALATEVDWGRLGLTLLAFFLALGIAAHALDELRGRPLGTEIPAAVLVVAATLSLAGSVAIGLVVAREVPWLLAFVAAGVFLVLAYNLELFGGAFHGDRWFAVAWGGFPVLVGAFAQLERITVAALVTALAATLLSLAQRRLSWFVRGLRRNVQDVAVHVTFADGRAQTQTRAELLAPTEAALRLLSAATVVLSLGLLASRW